MCTQIAKSKWLPLVLYPGGNWREYPPTLQSVLPDFESVTIKKQLYSKLPERKLSDLRKKKKNNIKIC